MTFKPHHDPSHLYFITATIMGWRKLFAKPTYAHVVLDSLDWHRRHGRWALYAYVVMPDHMHAVLKPAADQTISTVLQSFGSFTAHAILKQLQAEKQVGLLAFFARRQDQDSTKEHQIWLPIQPKNIHSVGFLREKVEYTHNNPIAKQWALVDDRADYPYSSARFYDYGLPPVVEVDDVRDWMV
jgi:REP element-mobilizing transposase RayT